MHERSIFEEGNVGLKICRIRIRDRTIGFPSEKALARNKNYISAIEHEAVIFHCHESVEFRGIVRGNLWQLIQDFYGWCHRAHSIGQKCKL